MLGQRLRELRTLRRMTQEHLADKSGVGQTHISDLERGAVANPSVDTIGRLAGALEVPVRDLARAIWPDLDTPPHPTRRGLTTAQEGHLYSGYRTMALRPDGDTYCVQAQAYVDAKPLPNHNRGSDGIEWGFPGAGPRALAYDILAYEFGPSVAEHHYTAFSKEVAGFLREISQEFGEHKEWEITSHSLRAWMDQQPRPHPIHRKTPPCGGWIADEGRLRATSYEEFLPGQRFVFKLEWQDQWPKVVSAIEQRAHPHPTLGQEWQYVRDVDPGEYA